MEKFRNPDAGILILRLSLGVLMLLHGIAKLVKGVGGIAGMMEESGLPGFLAYGVFIGEVVAPVLLIIGFRVRLAALAFAGTMIVAVFLAHSADVFSLTKSGGWAIELLGLYLFGALALFFTGGGNFALSQKSKWD
jgi:putative oxidoreductase